MKSSIICTDIWCLNNRPKYHITILGSYFCYERIPKGSLGKWILNFTLLFNKKADSLYFVFKSDGAESSHY